MQEPIESYPPLTVADSDAAAGHPPPLSAPAQRRLLREVRNLQAIERFMALVFGAIGGGWVWEHFHFADAVLSFWLGVAVSALGFAVVSAAIGLTNLAVSIGATPVGGRRNGRLIGQAMQTAVGRLVLGILGGGLLGALFGAIAWPVTAWFTGSEVVRFTFPGWLYGAYAAQRILTRFQYAGLEDPELI
jgi:hypothetical protein